MQIQNIPIDRIFLREDARKIDEPAVSGLMESIREVGLINPIRVRPERVFIGGVGGEGFRVTAGAHRLQACSNLGWAEIPALVVTEDALHAEMAKLDENLCRADLSAAERAKQTARRKEIYLELHPDTAWGQPTVSRQVGAPRQKSTTDAFHIDTAAKSGKSARAVQRDAERGEKIVPEVLDRIAGTRLDQGRYLDKIKAVAPDKQLAKVEKDMAAPMSKKGGKTTHAQRLRSCWNTAPMQAKQAFVAEFADEITGYLPIP